MSLKIQNNLLITFERNCEGVNILKRYDFTEELAEFVDDNDYEDGEEILIQLDGREICKAIVVRDGDDIDFKVIALR